MAQTAAFTDFVVPGNGKAGIAEISFSGTDYLTGGVSPIAAILAATGLVTLTDISFVAIGPVLTSTIYAAAWDKANQKVLLYALAGTQVANAANISTIKLYFYVKGNY